MTDHTALIERLERAEAGSRDLDAAVTVALRLDCKRNMEDDLHYLSVPRRDDECAPGTYWFHQRSGMSLRTSEPVTTSLDAAVALVGRVLPGWFWRGGHVPASHWQGGRAVNGWAHVSRTYADHCDRKDEATGWGSTPALALCIALLKAIPAPSHSLARDEGDSRSEHNPLNTKDTS